MEESAQKRIIQITGFRGKEKEDVTKLLLKLDCTFIKNKQYRNCTHLIAKRACKSEKYLAACAAGKWVLTKDYIINSAESGRWLDETTYEWGYKIEKDSHYSPQMQSAPKRWRKELTSTGAPGAFHRWKVVLLVKEGSKARDSLIRVLGAGKAQVFLPKNSPNGITHVITMNTNSSSEKAKYAFEAPYYPVQYLVDFLFLERQFQNDDGAVQRTSLFTEHVQQERKATDSKTDCELADLKKALRKHICRVEAMKYSCIELTKIAGCSIEVKNTELPRSIFNTIEILIEGQFFTEALEELVLLQPHYIPPVCLLHAFLRSMLQGNTVALIDRYFRVLSVLLHLHPPWKSPTMLNYYLEFFQCPNCMKGIWSFVEVLIRSCLFRESFCHPIPEGIVESKMLNMALLTFFLKLVKREVQHLNHKLYEGADSQSLKVKEQTFLLKTFWSGNETSVFFTKPINMLLDWTIYSHKEKFKSNDAFKNEMAYLLTGILGAVVEYWIFLSLMKDRNVMQQMSDHLGNYVAVSCDDFSSQELESFINSFSSSWLQMFIAESVFKKSCLQSCISISPEPLSLQKMVCAYLPALGKINILEPRKGQKRKKMGHWDGPNSQRALKMLSDGDQNQVNVLPEAPELRHSLSLKRLQKKSEGELSHSKENYHSLLPKMNFHKTNLKGETALHRACINNQVEKLILLLSLPGTDINVKDYAGWTPLHEACNHGNTVCVQEILQRCPEVDLLTQVDGVTPLHDALSNGHVEIGKLLLQHGGSVLLQQRTSKGKLPLDYVLAPQVKEDLLAVLQIKSSTEDHAQAEEHFYHQQIEFGSFLLSRMLLNFCSIFDLFSNFSVFKELAHLHGRLFTSPRTRKDATRLHNDWIMDLYSQNLVTLEKLPSLLKEIPKNLEVFSGVQTQALLMTLKTMINQAQTFHGTS
ncbi:SMC5-SMC6 complex localization factor protein 1 [Gracilinanus agilis]|uniref:SMC5-SMC6 complex localization factor protein 1 n=1 Tax=Gracilinanus agilis TaxID=191870 RepID=UPI001CFD2B82|nr:SMC5-SMC6 complex localization factor protein 1 [Gracilinanus agilis]